MDEKEMKKAMKRIYEAWIGAVIIGVLNILYFSYLIMKGDPNYNLGSIIIMLPIFPLAFGVYKKSRICAIILLSLTILETVATIYSVPFENWLKANWLIMRGVILYVFFDGVRGTVAYHKLLKNT